VLSFLRKGETGSVLVALNMSAQDQNIKFDLSGQGLQSTKAHTLLTAPKTGSEIDLNRVSLLPFGVIIAEVR
jgi:hypothetical protein